MRTALGPFGHRRARTSAGRCRAARLQARQQRQQRVARLHRPEAAQQVAGVGLLAQVEHHERRAHLRARARASCDSAPHNRPHIGPVMSTVRCSWQFVCPCRRPEPRNATLPSMLCRGTGITPVASALARDTSPAAGACTPAAAARARTCRAICCTSVVLPLPVSPTRSTGSRCAAAAATASIARMACPVRAKLPPGACRRQPPTVARGIMGRRQHRPGCGAASATSEASIVAACARNS